MDPKAYLDVYAKAKPTAEGGREESRTLGGGKRIEAVTLGADGRWSAAAHIDDRVVVCDLSDFSMFGTSRSRKSNTWPGPGRYRAGTLPGRQAAGRLIEENKAVLWEVATGKELFLPQIPFEMTRLAFSPDGNTLAIGGTSQVLLWSVKDEHIRRVIADYDHGVRSFAFSPDGAMLATGSASASDRVALWDIVTGQNSTNFAELVAARRHSPSATTGANSTRAPGVP